MKTYKLREKYQAFQYNGEPHERILIGKSDIHDRFDDTPNGPYVIAQGHAGRYNRKVNIGDWVVFRGNDILGVWTNEEFHKTYKEHKNEKPT